MNGGDPGAKHTYTTVKIIPAYKGKEEKRKRGRANRRTFVETPVFAFSPASGVIHRCNFQCSPRPKTASNPPTDRPTDMLQMIFLGRKNKIIRKAPPAAYASAPQAGVSGEKWEKGI